MELSKKYRQIPQDIPFILGSFITQFLMAFNACRSDYMILENHILAIGIFCISYLLGRYPTDV